MSDRRDYAPSLKLGEGGIVCGKVVDYQTVTGGKWGDRFVMVLQPEQGEAVSIWIGAVLKRLLKKTRPQIGERIAIKYVGEVQGKQHRYHDYHLALERNGDSLDFSDDAPDTETRAFDFDRSLAKPPPANAPDPF